jgi:hypothetical protein
MNNFDIFVPVHYKDSVKIDFLLESIFRNIHGFDKIYLVTNFNFQSKFKSDKIIVLNEKEVLDVDFEKIKYRNSWTYQQFLKLFQNVTKDWFLVIDSDCYVNKHIEIFNGDKFNFLFDGRENLNLSPFYSFSSKFLNVNRSYNKQFVSEIMVFNRNIILEIFKNIGLNTVNEMIDYLCENIKRHECLSEFELYGSYVHSKHPDLYNYKDISCFKTGFQDFEFEWDESSIVDLIFQNPDVDLITYNTYREDIANLEWQKGQIENNDSLNLSESEKKRRLNNIQKLVLDGRN